MSKYICVDGIETLIELVDAPVIEIVRCKDCKYWWKENELCAEAHHTVDGVCGVDAKADDYCSYGERKEQEHENR